MKSLKVIQILSKIAWVICIIVFICAIIGTVGCAIGLIVLPLTKDMVVQDGKTLAQLLIDRGTNIETAITACAVGLVGCGAGIALSKITELFFKKELALGTPFKAEVVHDMRRLALIHIITSLAVIIVLGIAIAVVKYFNPQLGAFRSYLGGTILLGIFLLILSLFCDYGVEMETPKVEDKTEEPKAEENKD